MVDEIIENIFLVNAPAGSGKTTWIRKHIENYILEHPKDNVLCITYTNRAAEELGKDLDSDRVYFGTIHSFINDFISNFFSHDSIIKLYFEIYEKRILERINNIKDNPNWKDSNERYKEKHGSLNLDVIRANIEKISYNQTSFNFLYEGGLGHDDLISFTRLAVDRFPVIKKKISDKYQLIFIDEYQDTSSDVLHIFYSSVKKKKSKLYLLGDKMQQIYRNYDGKFEDYFQTFDKSVKLSINYRTTPRIVNILNNIYNDEKLKQNSYAKNSNQMMDFEPTVLIVNDVEKAVVEFTNKYKNVLVLYLKNKDRFVNIGAGGLYEAYSKMEKYRFGKKYSVIDVLTKEEIRNKDTLMSFLFMVENVVRNYKKKIYGEVFKSLHKGDIYCNLEKYNIKNHSDKKNVKAELEKLKTFYDQPSITIDSFLQLCEQHGFLKKEFYHGIVDDIDYQKIKDVCLHEVTNLIEYLNNPMVSTQHGVKGESHDTVVFVATNNNTNPIVHMSKFFELWTKVEITLSKFDEFYYQYEAMIRQVENSVEVKCSDLNKDIYSNVSSEIDEILESYIIDNHSNQYYIHLLKEKMDKYRGKKNVKNLKDCLKEGNVYGSLCAYRLFYVGCSRARRNLLVIIDQTYVNEFENELEIKLSQCGFNVVRSLDKIVNVN